MNISIGMNKLAATKVSKAIAGTYIGMATMAIMARAITVRTIIKTIRLAMLILLVFSINGCSSGIFKIYKQNIQQGNYVTESMLNKLRVGLTKAEVQDIMGSATLVPVLNQNRWDYDYSLVPGDGSAPTKSKLSLYFVGDTLQTYTGDWNIKNLPRKQCSKCLQKDSSNK